MLRWLSLLCHPAVLLAAFHWSHSAGGFVVSGPGLCLLLDRYFLRRLPWAGPVAWGRELRLRGTCFALGAAVFYWMRPGVVPIREALYRGAVVTLTVFLSELPVRLGRGPIPAWRRGLGARLVLLGLVVAVAPLVAALHPLHIVPKRTPAALGLPFEDVRIETPDGLRLAAWLVPHPEARGSVLFCHGHGRNRGHVAGFLQTLHGLRLNVLAFDFRGHGDSPGNTSTFGRREVQDVLAAARYLRARCPGKPLLLVGVSLGAAVALQALPRLPDVRGVWSEGCFSRLTDVADNYFRWLPAWLRRPLLAAYYELGFLDCGFRAEEVNPIDCLAGVRVPVCFCHGRADTLVPFREAAALHDACAGPREHYWVEGGTHYDLRQRHREEYFRHFRDFIEACLAGPPSPPGRPRVSSPPSGK